MRKLRKYGMEKKVKDWLIGIAVTGVLIKALLLLVFLGNHLSEQVMMQEMSPVFLNRTEMPKLDMDVKINQEQESVLSSAGVPEITGYSAMTAFATASAASSAGQAIGKFMLWLNENGWKCVNAMMDFARPFEGIGHLLFPEKALRSWSNSVGDFFDNSILGGPSYWTAQQCKGKAPKRAGGTIGFVTTEKGVTGASAHVEGHKITIKHYDEDMQDATEYIYKISYMVRAVDRDMKYNLYIDNKPYYVDSGTGRGINKEVSAGETDGAGQRTMIVFKSYHNFEYVKLVFSEDYFDMNSNILSNKIVEVEGLSEYRATTLPGSTGSSGSLAGGAGGSGGTAVTTGVPTVNPIFESVTS